MSKLLIKKEEIGDCRRCGEKSLDVEFSGRMNIQHNRCSHFNSQDGWWLRIDHIRNEGSVFDEEDKDVVGELLCPPCNKKKIEHEKDIFGL